MEKSARIHSLDQFRGYTVLGMFAVNFLGSFAAIPAVLRHHNTYCSYADVIMPHFFFAVGFALRLVILKEIARSGVATAYWRGVKRGWALVLFGILFYQLDGSYRTWEELKTLGLDGFFSESFRRSAFQALTHIGVTSLWILPVIGRGKCVRLGFIIFSAVLHLWISKLFWYETLHEWRVIDGGLLGFLTWTVPTLAGAYAYDWVRAGPRSALRPLLGWGLVLMLVGYGLSCLGAAGWAAPPFFPPTGGVDIWTMSQRAGSLSYLTFCAGLSLAVYALFVWLCDLRHWHSEILGVLGRNAFAGYVLHMIIMNGTEPFSPRDAPLWYALLISAFGSCLAWRMTKWCNERNLYLRL